MVSLFKILLVALPWICESHVISVPRRAKLSIAEPMPSYYFTNINETRIPQMNSQRSSSNTSGLYTAYSVFLLATFINCVPGTYSFGYDSYDPVTGQMQYRMEERYPNGTVVGSYGYVDARGRPQRYRYIADEKGYRVRSDPIQATAESTKEPVVGSTEPSVTWTRPKKPTKNKEENSYLIKLPIKKNYNTNKN